MIRSRLLWVVCLMLASVEVVACSFSGSPVFKVGRARMNASEGKAETLTLVRVNFIPAISGMGSCDGTGLITVQVRSDRGGKRHFKQRGILVLRSRSSPMSTKTVRPASLGPGVPRRPPTRIDIGDGVSVSGPSIVPESSESRSRSVLRPTILASWQVTEAIL